MLQVVLQSFHSQYSAKDLVKQSCDLAPFPAVIKSNCTHKSYHLIGRHHKRLFKGVSLADSFVFDHEGMAKIRLILKPYNTSFFPICNLSFFQGAVLTDLKTNLYFQGP
jgi:hypothetical protein